MTDDLRRVDDVRFRAFEKKLDQIERKVDGLSDVLTEPEKSVVGRNLLSRAQANAGNIVGLEKRVNNLESWQDQIKGSWSFVRATQVVLGIIVAALTLIAMGGQLKP